MLPREARRQIPVPRSPVTVTYSICGYFSQVRLRGARARGPRTPASPGPVSPRLIPVRPALRLITL